MSEQELMSEVHRAVRLGCNDNFGTYAEAFAREYASRSLVEKESELAATKQKLAQWQALVFTVRTILASSVGPTATSAVAHIQKHFADNGAELTTLLSAAEQRGYDRCVEYHNSCVGKSGTADSIAAARAEGVEEGKKLMVEFLYSKLPAPTYKEE